MLGQNPRLSGLVLNGENSSDSNETWHAFTRTHVEPNSLGPVTSILLDPSNWHLSNEKSKNWSYTLYLDTSEKSVPRKVRHLWI